MIIFPYVPTALVVERPSFVEGTEATRSDSVRFSFLAIGTNPGPCIHGACAHEAGRVSKCVGLTGSLEEGCHETSGVFADFTKFIRILVLTYSLTKIV